MASSVSRPSTYGLRIASGTAARTTNIKSSAPRMRSSLFHMPVGSRQTLRMIALPKTPVGRTARARMRRRRPGTSRQPLPSEKLAMLSSAPRNMPIRTTPNPDSSPATTATEKALRIKAEAMVGGTVVAPPDVLGNREEEEAEDDGEQDPPFALLLQRQPHRGPLDEEAQGRAEEQARRHHQPVGKAQHDQREREGRRDHHQLALAE